MNLTEDQLNRTLTYRDMFILRAIDDPCIKCYGFGIRCYGNTTTWHGGIGGQAMTNDVCDHCWGSGDENKHGADLRKITNKIANLERQVEEKEKDVNK